MKKRAFLISAFLLGIPQVLLHSSIPLITMKGESFPFMANRVGRFRLSLHII